MVEIPGPEVLLSSVKLLRSGATATFSTPRIWEQMPRVLYITTNEPDICTMWRAWWVCSELAARGYIADYCTFNGIGTYVSAINYGRYNTIITPRLMFDSMDAEQQFVGLMKALNKRIKWWYDADDDLFAEDFTDRVLMTHSWENPGRAERQHEFFRKSRIRMLQEVDGITVASPKLVETVSKLTSKPVLLVPNGINAGLYEQSVMAAKREISPVTVGWSGGPRLEADLEPLYDAWAQLAQENADVKFVLQGWAPEKMKRCVPSDRVTIIDGVPVEKYPAILTNIDIFCCVSQPDDFNQSKTPIKYWEATLAGAACIASPTLYGPDITDGVTGYVAKTSSDWVTYMDRLAKSLELRFTLNSAAKVQVLANHTLRNTYKEWLEAWAFLTS